MPIYCLRFSDIFTKQLANLFCYNNNTERNQNNSVLKSPATILSPTKDRNMSYNIKATIFVFPHTKLTKIIGKPNHENVTLLHKEINAKRMYLMEEVQMPTTQVQHAIVKKKVMCLQQHGTTHAMDAPI